jgi:3-ketosteroid 9alpha-monooxygenase subunit A
MLHEARAALEGPSGPRFGLGYPEGWFQVAYSEDLTDGQVVALRYFARDLVLFRTARGQAQVLDAHCAHLGAHLGVGGKIDGDCIRCPFHSWAYDVDGVCREIPYAERIPRGAHVRPWTTLERSGLIFVWYSATMAQPQWEPPEVAECGDPDWVGYLRNRYVFRSVVQDVIENVFDVSHSQFVHQNAQGAAAPAVEFSFNGHRAEADFDIDLPLVGGKTRHLTTLHGPGIALSRSTGHGTKTYLTTYTPIDDEFVDVNFSFMTPRSTPDDPAGERSVRSAQATGLLFEQDIPIWENKTYRHKPLFCDGDGVLSQFRVWVRQFYSTESIGDVVPL